MTALKIGGADSDTSNSQSGPIVSIFEQPNRLMQDKTAIISLNSHNCVVKCQQLRFIRCIIETGTAKVPDKYCLQASSDGGYMIYSSSLHCK